MLAFYGGSLDTVLEGRDSAKVFQFEGLLGESTPALVEYMLNAEVGAPSGQSDTIACWQSPPQWLKS